MSIKIIGAGLPRTGTNTLKVSLVTLGYCKHVYHMKELLVNPERLHLWKTLDDTGDTDWDVITSYSIHYTKLYETIKCTEYKKKD